MRNIRHFVKMVKNFKDNMFTKHLLITNTVSGGVLLGSGDVIQQVFERYQGYHKGRRYDTMRTWRMFVVGLLQGPPHHYWYTWLDKVFRGKDLKTIAKKILSDQFIAAPFFAITFFLGMGYMEGKDFGAILREFNKKFPYVYLFDWCIWPPTQYINFLWVPGAYRVIYVNAVTVCWDVFLSYIKHREQFEKDFTPMEAFFHDVELHHEDNIQEVEGTQKKALKNVYQVP
ncbi:unnamed protein product [Darwinula stevensoni]|uniref:Mpv17-like protein 2 n=1 Tax=Darwinula stevensoni TaxID=69355 RepID=A0A7R9ACG8_9CRUS|nr:unnamed protein product [Darwinula stevensoni]CAG0900353.1 unnamed protein product [Darwinula stevensoni]